MREALRYLKKAIESGSQSRRTRGRGFENRSRQSFTRRRKDHQVGGPQQTRHIAAYPGKDNALRGPRRGSRMTRGLFYAALASTRQNQMAIALQPQDPCENRQKPGMILGGVHPADMNAQRAAGGNSKLPPHSAAIGGSGELGGVDAGINHSASRLLPPCLAPRALEAGSTPAE